MYLRLEGITKSFPGVVANCGINLDVGRGEIHAVLGENGAGKSTLMKVLYGFWQPDAGTISVDGKRLDLRSPSDAIRAGIGMVFQSFMLIPAFSVAENIALTLPGSGVLLRVSAIRARLREFGSRYGLSVDADAKVWQLSVGEQQRVEIVKLLVSGARVLILDEPTSVLAPHEVTKWSARCRGRGRPCRTSPTCCSANGSCGRVPSSAAITSRAGARCSSFTI